MDPDGHHRVFPPKRVEEETSTSNSKQQQWRVKVETSERFATDEFPIRLMIVNKVP